MYMGYRRLKATRILLMCPGNLFGWICRHPALGSLASVIFFYVQMAYLHPSDQLFFSDLGMP